MVLNCKVDFSFEMSEPLNQNFVLKPRFIVLANGKLPTYLQVKEKLIFSRIFSRVRRTPKRRLCFEGDFRGPFKRHLRGHSRSFFLLFSTFQQLTVLNMFHYKSLRWLESNCGPLVKDATAMPTEPQPLPQLPKFQGCRYQSFLWVSFETLGAKNQTYFIRWIVFFRGLF